MIPSKIFAAPDFSLLGQFNFGAFSKLGVTAAILWIFSLMLSDFFDTMGTLVGVGAQAGYLDDKGHLTKLNRLLLIDSLAAVAGGAASSSSATTYIESGAGVAQGGRTGMVGITSACSSCSRCSSRRSPASCRPTPPPRRSSSSAT